MSKHPKYENDTILEALCELRLVPAVDSAWNPARPGELYQTLAGSFPQMEPVTEMGLELSMTASGPSQKIVQGPPKLKFASEDNTKVVQVAQGAVIFSHVRKYPGWDSVLHMIMEYWPKVCSVLRPSEVQRIGLRYINRIPLSDRHPDLRDWLKPTNFLPPALVNSRQGFSGRIEAWSSKTELTIITLGHQRPTPSDPQPAIIYDIDRISQLRVQEDLPDVENRLVALHEDVWSRFEEAQTDLLVKYLRGEKI